METFSAILDYISRTNLFNFIIFMAIIIWVVNKIKVADQLEQSRKDVETVINESSSAKEESLEKLSNIEQSMLHIGEEIDEILSNSENNAKVVGDKILDDAKKSALVIQDNMQKAIQNSRVLLKNDLIKRASLASVEVAKNHIINELNNNHELHDRLIDESIEALALNLASVFDEVENKEGVQNEG